MSNRKVQFGKEAREKTLEGVRKICRAVKVTLGPAGRNVLIARSEYTTEGIQHYPLHLTKDGVTVARAFDLNDMEESVGARLIKEAAQKTVEQAGDSTTTTCVLAEAIIEKGAEFVNNGFNPVLIKKGIDMMVAKVVEHLKKISTPVKGSMERIRQVATVSANNDDSIGQLLVQAYEKIGEDGMVRLEDSKSVSTKVKVTDGFMFARGWISPYFVTNTVKMTCEYPTAATSEKPTAILLFDRPITQMNQIKDILKKVVDAGRPLLIICEDLDHEALQFLNQNVFQKRITACAVKTPFIGDRREDAMEDIAILTGAKYFSNAKGMKIENAKYEDLGSARAITVTKDETVIIDGAFDYEKRQARLDELAKAKESAETDEEKEYLELRIARLKGSVAIIEVGGATEVEMKEKKDRIDDAIKSVKASLIDGFVPGGGTAFVRTSKELANSLDVESPSEVEHGKAIVLDALDMPLKTICQNAGADADAIWKQVFDQSGNFGYNAQTEKIEDLVDSGIIDATKVLTAALINAASVAGAFLTMEATIVDTF